MSRSLTEPAARPTQGGVAYLIWGLAASVVLFGWVLAQRRGLLGDEALHLRPVLALPSAPSFAAWLRNNESSACGPLLPVMQYWLSGAHGLLPAPWFRLPNLLLLGAIMGLTARMLSVLKQPRVLALAYLGVPMTWVVGGLALTEIPAMAGAALAACAAVMLGTDGIPQSSRRGWLLCLAGGIVVATLGRQQYLAVVPGLLVMATRSQSNLRPVGLTVLAALGPFALLVATWGGLVPPRLAFAAAGLKPLHAVYAFSYLGLVVCLMAPRFLAAHWRWALPAGLAAAVLNVGTGYARFTLMTSAQKMIGSPGWGRLIEQAMAGLAVLAGAGFAAALVASVWRQRERVHAGMVLAVVALGVAPSAVSHQFSSRYPAMALPFLLVTLAPWMTCGRFALLRNSAGALLGFAALRSYFLYAP